MKFLPSKGFGLATCDRGRWSGSAMGMSCRVGESGGEEENGGVGEGTVEIDGEGSWLRQSS